MRFQLQLLNKGSLVVKQSYSSGQIVYYKGSYYQSRVDDLKNVITVEDELGNFQGQFAVFPDDDFYVNENGQTVKNTFWAKLSDEGDLNHVLSFSTLNENRPGIRLPESGAKELTLPLKLSLTQMVK